jgi:triacylglycerol lipase
MSEAVVIVSGGSAISPFTTPTAACAQGQAAGSTDTYLRAGLLQAGRVVYTAPAFAGPQTATADSGFAGFAEPPEVLDEELTINSVGTIDAAGARLAAFVSYLHQRFGHHRFHLVAHSMGGLFSTAAINQLQGSAIRVASLTTLGTPWRGGFAADYAAGDLPFSAANGDAGFEQVLTAFADEVARLPQPHAGQQVTARFLDEWLPTQTSALAAVKVTLLGADAFTGSGVMWPNDGLVTLASALAEGTTAPALSQAPRHTFHDAHSIYFADQFDLPWERAITWDPEALQTVLSAVALAS